ncbi:MAG: carboxypeptidase-like regulatory domain-containing protein [Planctomycetota bacterium]
MRGRSAIVILGAVGAILLLMRVTLQQEHGAGAPALGQDAGAAAVALPALVPADLVEAADVAAAPTVRPEEQAPLPLVADASTRTDASLPEPLDDMPPLIEAAVSGVVVDADGRPIEGARVTLLGHAPRSKGPTSPGAQARNSALSSSNGARVTTFRAVTTDHTGAFLVPRSQTWCATKLLVRSPTLLDEQIEADVDQLATHQVVRLPRAQLNNSTWTVEVFDADGAPVQIRGAEVAFVARTGPKSIAPPRALDLTIEGNRVVQRGLCPARWRLKVDVERSLGGRLEWSFTEPESERHAALTVAVFPDGAIDRFVPEPSATGKPWVDLASGFEAYVPGERLAVGERRGDAFFSATLRFGPGPVRAAVLELELRAMQAMSRNDSLALEFVTAKGPGPNFVWNRKLSDLTGLAWEPEQQASLRLDLARLPLDDGGTYSLLPALADGQLDVVVQDDTTVVDIALRVVR